MFDRTKNFFKDIALTERHPNLIKKEGFAQDGFDNYVDKIYEKINQKEAEDFSKANNQIIVEEEKVDGDQSVVIIQKSQTNKKDEKPFYKQNLDRKSITLGSSFSAIRIQDNLKPKFKKSGLEKKLII